MSLLAQFRNQTLTPYAVLFARHLNLMAEEMQRYNEIGGAFTGQFRVHADHGVEPAPLRREHVGELQLPMEELRIPCDLLDDGQCLFGRLVKSQRDGDETQ